MSTRTTTKRFNGPQSVTKNWDIGMFIEREAVMFEEQMNYQKKKNDETIEFLIKRGVIYRER